MDLNAIIETNPKVKRDAETLQAALTAVRDLRNNGIKSRTYGLASPFERRRKFEGSRLANSAVASSDVLANK